MSMAKVCIERLNDSLIKRLTITSSIWWKTYYAQVLILEKCFWWSRRMKDFDCTNMRLTVVLEYIEDETVVLGNSVVLVQQVHIRWCILPGFSLMIIDDSESLTDIWNILQSMWTSALCNNLTVKFLTWCTNSKGHCDLFFASLDTTTIWIDCAVWSWWCCAML